MVALSVVAGIFIIVLCFILFTPLVLEIDSTRKVCEIRLTGLAKAGLVFDKDSVTVLIKALWWKKAINPFHTGRHVDEAGKTPPVKGNKAGPSFRRVPGKLWAVATSFRVKHFYINTDTGDFMLNAWLYPIAWLLQASNRHLQVNYAGVNVVKIKMVNNAAKILWAIIT